MAGFKEKIRVLALSTLECLSWLVAVTLVPASINCPLDHTILQLLAVVAFILMGGIANIGWMLIFKKKHLEFFQSIISLL